MPNKMYRLGAAIAAACVMTGVASSAPFGSMLIVNNVKVVSIFRGAYGPAYVTFTPATLTGCNGNYGGYLSSMWSEVMTPDPSAAKDQLALLMLAKSTDATLEVRYRVNQTGTGWDKCAIDAIWVQ